MQHGRRFGGPRFGGVGDSKYYGGEKYEFSYILLFRKLVQDNMYRIIIDEYMAPEFDIYKKS